MRRRFWSLNGPGRLLLAVAIVVLAAAVGALAYWTAPGSGAAAGGVRTLAAPTITSSAPGQETAALSWMSVAPPAGVAGVSYYVSRDGGAPGGSCATSSSPSSATSCTDSGASPGNHTYTVTAVWRSWTAKSSSVSVAVISNPVVSSTSPTSRGQGASNQSVTIKGSHFVKGASPSFSGSRIAVNSSAFVSSTEITANVTVASNAPVGGRTVTVTNPDAGVATSGEIFTVNAAPTVDSTSPSSRGQGASSQTVTIKGKSFVSGATSSFGAGITVELDHVQIVDRTDGSDHRRIRRERPERAMSRSPTPTRASATGSEVFTVNAGPTVESTTPELARSGRRQTERSRSKARTSSAARHRNFGAGVTVESTSFVSATELTAKISVESAAAPGGAPSRSPTQTPASARWPAPSRSTPSPTVTSTSPSSRGQGAANQTIKITGSGFVNGATLAASFSGTGVIVNSTSFVSSTEITANVTVESGASVGKRTITVINGDAGVATSGEIFTVNAKPTVSSTSPSSRGQGAANQTIKITGSGFVNGATLASAFSGIGIIVNSTSFVSSTEITANVTVESGAAATKRTVTVSNGDAGVATSGEIFTVNAAPTVESTSPSSRGQGASSQTVTIKGKNFVSGATSSFGAGITVNSTTFKSSTELTAMITVESGAAPRARAM